VVDLGVVHVQRHRRPVCGPSPQERVDQDVEVLAVVVAGLEDEAAVAVDPHAQVRRDHLALLQHIGSFLEVAQPQRVGPVAASPPPHRLAADPELDPRGPGLLEHAVQRGLGHFLP